MENKEFARRLEERTRKFAVRIIQLSTKLPNMPEGRVIKNQLTKCGTSIGANYREANRARSRADFKNKMKICESEASETQYWLEVIIAVGWSAGTRQRPDQREPVVDNVEGFGFVAEVMFAAWQGGLLVFFGSIRIGFARLIGAGVIVIPTSG